jgi:hypothetical protein
VARRLPPVLLPLLWLPLLLLLLRRQRRRRRTKR